LGSDRLDFSPNPTDDSSQNLPQFNGRVVETGDGVAFAPDSTIYVGGTTTSVGAGNQDALVLHLDATGKKLLDALT
jgi:hypothetical protein